MRRATRKDLSGVACMAAAIVILASRGWAIVPHPVAQSYADTVRIAVLSNDFATGPQGCTSVMPSVGPQTRDFVVAALDTTHFKNVKVANAPYANLDTILNLFSGKMPHVIVHVNAGWAGLSGVGFSDRLKWAAGYNVGIVEIGDDDGTLLGPVFGWLRVNPLAWAPMNTAQWLADSLDKLYIRLLPQRDVTVDASAYPFFKGLLRNTVSVLKDDSTLFFLRYDPYAEKSRCEADPDVYDIDSGKEHLVTFMAYQQGYNAVCDTVADSVSPERDASCDSIIGTAGQYHCISILQDTIDIGGSPGLRRAVSLSFQPQFLQDSVAAQQLVYDAVIYASLVHRGNPTPPQVGVKQIRRSNLAAALAMAGMRGAKIRVADLNGRTIYEGSNDRQSIDASSRVWRNGVYLITVTTPAKVRTGLFVKSQ